MKTSNLNSIGHRVSEIRRFSKHTQEELAEILGVTPKHISHVENDTSNLSLSNLIRFCNYYECSLDYIVFGQNNNKALSKLPTEIIDILNTENENEIELLNKYLQIYIDIRNKQR